MKVLRCHDFSGAIYPVSRSHKNIMGLKAYPNIRSIPETVDLVFLAGGRGEHRLELHLLYRVFVRLETDQLALEAGPLRQERQSFLRRRNPTGEADANQNKARSQPAADQR